MVRTIQNRYLSQLEDERQEKAKEAVYGEFQCKSVVTKTPYFGNKVVKK